jgi:hypothetical protein
MYKLTVNGATMLGNNEDSWRHTSQIWFVPAVGPKYGAAYVGYADKQAADGGVNEHGLAFDAFSMPTKQLKNKPDANKKDFTFSQANKVLEQCKTVREVYTLLQSFNLHLLNGSPLFHGGMLLFADGNGEYLTVEADTMIFGSENKFVLANFSPATTKDLNTIKIERYCKGVQFLSNKIDTSLSFCTALSDTMSVSRSKIGDGTLYTSIYDLNKGLIYVYFFHDYKNLVTFNIKDELAKGTHTYPMTSLFPPNEAYNKFVNYKTPQNTPALKITLIVLLVVFLFTALYLLYQIVKRKSAVTQTNGAYKTTVYLMSIISLLLSYYCFNLLRYEGIFYFPSPYQDYHFSILNVMAYLPFLLLAAFIPLAVYSMRIYKSSTWNSFTKKLLLANNLLHVTVIILFAYWHLYNVFS